MLLLSVFRRLVELYKISHLKGNGRAKAKGFLHRDRRHGGLAKLETGGQRG
jgi:hypothetical protein